MKYRKKIPQSIKNAVYIRQNGFCACCLNRGVHLHHILAYSLTLGHINVKNIMLLCENHHKLFHLGDPETFQSIYEYAWYLQYHHLPEEKDLSEISEEVNKLIKEDFHKMDF
ncbi:MAG TPA: hypothetical protein VMZ91_12245 [Candidatus Paceibacterota bacterium]|nr:hypothetical protein [Candidatus Paceibacterota bacterium]